jgi:hypothetical protein
MLRSPARLFRQSGACYEREYGALPNGQRFFGGIRIMLEAIASRSWSSSFWGFGEDGSGISDSLLKGI